MAELLSLSSQAGLRRVYASELTPIDCDLNTGANISGAGSATDGTAAINAFLQSATSQSPVELIMDGGVLVTGVITAHSNVTITGLNSVTCGFFVKSASNSCVIHNGWYGVDDTGAAPAQAAGGYTLRHLKLNGNRPGNSSSTDKHGNGVWLFGAHICNVSNVRIEDVWVYDSPTFGILLGNCNKVTVDGCRVEAPNRDQNTDGVHLNGNTTNVHIANCYFKTGDDAIALNAREGWKGNITGVTITNCNFDGCASAVRGYTTDVPAGVPGYTVSRVSVSNCVGKFDFYYNDFFGPFIFGLNGNAGNTVDTIQDFSASHCTFYGSGSIMFVSENMGAVTLSDITWHSPSVSGSGSAFPWITFIGQANISSLHLSRLRCYRTAQGSQLRTGLVNYTSQATGTTSTCKIGKLVISGWDFDDEYGVAYGSIPYLLDMANNQIYELVIDALDSTNISALVNPATGFTGITLIRGAGLMSSGFELPPSLVANGSNFISNSSHLPSVKIGGTTKTYAVS